MHESDGYPTRWPADPTAWLSPPDCSAAFVACEDDGTVSGHVCVVTGVDDALVAALAGVSSDRLAGVSRLFTSPAVRGRGLALGARLLSAAQDWAQRRELQLMLDVVDDGAPAVFLYERLGWQLVDRRVADWTTPEGLRHDVRIYLAPQPG
ncbi:GNAT family N-acetyltransferase [Modestobacter marinus]|uniref:GNAT family N-acetyltransferase n=1 Tax=Modestobacter marinus TaxID=477641 RepID=UPI001E2C46A5